MGRLLDRLLSVSSAYEVRRESDGFLLIGKPEYAEEFSDLVRQAADEAGEDYIVFPTTDGHRRYSQMFILLTDRAAPGSQ